MFHARSQSCDAPVEEFELWQQRVRLPGISGRGGRGGAGATFLPYHQLEAYLTEDRIYNWLRAVYRQNGAGADLRWIASAIIAKRCIRVFAILFLIRYGHLITHVLEHPLDLGDERLPFSKTQRPTDFPGGQDVFREFCTIQDQYCVRPLKNLDVSFSADAILPIKSMTEIGSGDTAQAYKIEIHDGYNSIQPRQAGVTRRYQQHSNTFVLKRYRSNDAEACEDFRRECDAFATLSYDAADLNIIGYFGFIIIDDPADRQGDHCSNYLILEYADCGNLEEFWKRFPQPASAAASWTYWEQIFGLVKALDRIHFATPNASEDDETDLRGFHHDIRPWNVFVTHDYTNRDSKFPYQFLLGDLGLATFVRINNGAQSPSTEDPRSSLIYRAPELTREQWQSRWYLGIRQPADVWSLGAVFSEALVWSTLGYQWVQKYRKDRERESNGNGACFHNGTSVLEAVIEQHQICENRARQGEKLNREVVRLLEEYMLVNTPDQRKTARQLVIKANGILHRTKQQLPSEIKTTSETSSLVIEPTDLSIHSLSLDDTGKPTRRRTKSPRSTEASDTRFLRQGMKTKASMSHSQKNWHNQRSSTSSVASQDVCTSREEISRSEDPKADRPPSISVAQLQQWKKSKKNGEYCDASLKGLENLEELRNRDVMFIIDDSESMRKHWPNVKELVGLLAWAIKKFDRDGMDYIFLSEMKKRNSEHSTQIVQQTQLRAAHPSGRLNAARWLDDIFSDYAKQYQSKRNSIRSKLSEKVYGKKPEDHACKPCSYFIFTDAIWQPRCKVSTPIVKLMERLEGAKEHQVGISFIQFGNDEIGTRRLRFLDDGLKVRYKIPDVIDYEPSDGNVLKMLLGSINEWWDDDNTGTVDEERDWLDE